uniref:DNA mismatch repair proteins mutS family domain-containing protein n=1 Tax=viral metagenome TaxID=1070528 RepID=A0A6C0DHM4_9ZZZZ
MALIKEYFELTNKYINEYGENTILLMQVGSFYECYGKKYKDERDDKQKDNRIFGSKIMDFSQICDLNVVNKNTCVGEEGVVMAGFKVEFIEKYLRKIQEAGYTTIVYKQDESAKNTTRSLEGIYSPGTYFSTDSSILTNNLTCIWIEMINNKFTKGKVVIVGMSNIDIFTGKTNIFEYKENYIHSPTTFDELERFISIYNPSEVIMISNLLESETKDVINFINLKTNSIHVLNNNIDNNNNHINVSGETSLQNKQSDMIKRVKNCEKQIYQKELLQKFFKIYDFDSFFQNFYNNTIATQSFCFLLDFVYQHNPYLIHKISEPSFDNFSDRLVLANHSLKQLNIIDDSNYKGNYSSVLKMLNCCLTPMGRRYFDYKFLNPTTNVEYLKNEYDILEHFLNHFDKYSIVLKQQLKEIKDISKWERQIFIKKITPKSFYNLHKNIKIVKNIFKFIEEDSFIMKYLFHFDKTSNGFVKMEQTCDRLSGFIEKHLNLEAAKDIDQLEQFNQNFVNHGINDVLDKKTELMKDSENKLECVRVYLNTLIKNKEKPGANSTATTEYVKIHETEKNNYSLLTTTRRCKLLEDALTIESQTNQLTFYSSVTNKAKVFDFITRKKCFEYSKQSTANIYIGDDQINSICKTINLSKLEMRGLISLTFNKFVDEFGEQFQKDIECIIHFVTLIDLIYTKSFISKKYNYCKPNIVSHNNVTTKSFVEAKNLRHCLIEHLQTNEYYVTNDVILGNGETDGILLYGTNAVGKTSLIRALGISIIMAQSGFYVPCSEFNFIPYKYIFTRILGNDNIFKGLSTFAVEMSELRTILRSANENSIVLGDELCSGTEISSAISIFVSGIQKLSSFKSSYIFATHLHEIVNYEEITSITNLKLKHMEVIYDKENDCLVYDRKLKDGPGNCMYGLEVCKSLSLPTDFLENAYNIRMKYNRESGSILSLKQSHFNSKKIMGICEKCEKNAGTEVHHLQHQSEADDNGFINNNGYKIHKNNPANLLTLCEKCHNEFHQNEFHKDHDKTKVKQKRQYKKVKTSAGVKLQEL